MYQPCRILPSVRGVNLAQVPKPIQETLWSRAVQHGPKGAANIFSTAIESLGSRPGRPATQDLIASVYAIRSRQFGLSSPNIQAAVQQRFQEERHMALAMFANPPQKSV
jgi:Type VI secretion system spike protein VgrG3-like, C-terminal